MTSSPGKQTDAEPISTLTSAASPSHISISTSSSIEQPASVFPFGIRGRPGLNNSTGTDPTRIAKDNETRTGTTVSSSVGETSNTTTTSSNNNNNNGGLQGQGGILPMAFGLISTWFEFSLLLLRPLVSLLQPILQPITDFLTSPTFQRSALSFLIFLLVFTTLVLTSTGFYGVLYYWYVPGRGFGVDLWLQYGTARDSGPVLPTATVDLTQFGQRKRPLLTPHQRYDVIVDLRVPESEHNFKLGNFMVKAEMVDKDGNVVFTSSRPALVRHKSRLLRWLSTIAKAVPLVLDFWAEEQVIRIPVVENYIEQPTSRATQLVITLSTPLLQTYSSHLLLITHFTGLRYFMYTYRISTAIFIISLMVVLESITLFVIWRMLLTSFGGIGMELERRDGGGVASYRAGLDGEGWDGGLEGEEEDELSSLGTEEDGFDDDEEKEIKQEPL